MNGPAGQGSSALFFYMVLLCMSVIVVCEYWQFLLSLQSIPLCIVV